MSGRQNHLMSNQHQHRVVQNPHQVYTSPVRVQQAPVNLVTANTATVNTTGLQGSVPLSGSVNLSGPPLQQVVNTTQSVQSVRQPLQYQVVQQPQTVVVQERAQPVVVQERAQPVIVQERVIQSPPPQQVLVQQQQPQVIVQEKIVEKPVYYEKEVEKIIDRPVEVTKIEYVDVEKKVEVPVYFENEEKINQLNIELNEWQMKYQAEVNSHGETRIHLQQIIEDHENEKKDHDETKKRANKKPKIVEKEVFVDVVKEVPVEKIVTEYVDREVVRTVENVDEINRLKGDVDFWRRKAEEWESKYVQLSQEEVEYQVVQTRTRGTLGGSQLNSTTTVKDSQKLENVLRQSMSPSNTNMRSSMSPSKQVVNETVKHSGRHSPSTHLRSSGYTYTNNESYVKSPSRTVYYEN